MNSLLLRGGCSTPGPYRASLAEFGWIRRRPLRGRSQRVHDLRRAERSALFTARVQRAAALYRLSRTSIVLQLTRSPRAGSTPPTRRAGSWARRRRSLVDVLAEQRMAARRARLHRGAGRDESRPSRPARTASTRLVDSLRMDPPRSGIRVQSAANRARPRQWHVRSGPEPPAGGLIATVSAWLVPRQVGLGGPRAGRERDGPSQAVVGTRPGGGPVKPQRAIRSRIGVVPTASSAPARGCTSRRAGRPAAPRRASGCWSPHPWLNRIRPAGRPVLQGAGRQRALLTGRFHQLAGAALPAGAGRATAARSGRPGRPAGSRRSAASTWSMPSMWSFHEYQ